MTGLIEKIISLVDFLGKVSVLIGNILFKKVSFLTF